MPSLPDHSPQSQPRNRAESCTQLRGAYALRDSGWKRSDSMLGKSSISTLTLVLLCREDEADALWKERALSLSHTHSHCLSRSLSNSLTVSPALSLTLSLSLSLSFQLSRFPLSRSLSLSHCLVNSILACHLSRITHVIPNPETAERMRQTPGGRSGQRGPMTRQSHKRVAHRSLSYPVLSPCILFPPVIGPLLDCTSSSSLLLSSLVLSDTNVDEP